jgi:hypothetical protein
MAAMAASVGHRQATAWEAAGHRGQEAATATRQSGVQSLEANRVSSRWRQGAGLVGGDLHGWERWQSLGPHGRRVACAGGGGWVTGLAGGKLSG